MQAYITNIRKLPYNVDNFLIFDRDTDREIFFDSSIDMVNYCGFNMYFSKNYNYENLFELLPLMTETMSYDTVDYSKFIRINDNVYLTVPGERSFCIIANIDDYRVLSIVDLYNFEEQIEFITNNI